MDRKDQQDKIYATKQDKIRPFEFNEEVTDVFDDMLSRSVPMYREIIKRQAQLAVKYYQKDSIIYDLGCSNGNLGMCLIEEMGGNHFSMIAIDNSTPMLDVFEKRLSSHPERKCITLECQDIQKVAMVNASVIVINLTLQFLPVHNRNELITHTYDALLPDGILLITEKVVHQDQAFSKLQQEFHHTFKKERGYSNLEISQKRDALENVLIPETIEAHLRRFNQAGFLKIDIWQKWFNFVSFFCQK